MEIKDIPVTVIIPAFNRAAFLFRAVDSVLSQSHRAVEIIVVDDGSTDNTLEVLTRYGDTIVVVSQPNRGPAAARNLGISRASHDFIAFLDSDDWFISRKIERQLVAMVTQPAYLISHTQEVWYRRGQFLNQKNRHEKARGYIFARALQLCCVSPSTVMVRRRFFEEVGLFDESMPCCEDYELWLRAGVHQPFLLIDEALTCKDGGRPDQLSVIYSVGMDRYRIDAIMKVLEGGTLSPAQEKLAREELVNKCRIYGHGCQKHDRPDEAEHYLALAASYGEK